MRRDDDGGTDPQGIVPRGSTPDPHNDETDRTCQWQCRGANAEAPTDRHHWQQHARAINEVGEPLVVPAKYEEPSGSRPSHPKTAKVGRQLERRNEDGTNTDRVTDTPTTPTQGAPVDTGVVEWADDGSTVIPITATRCAQIEHSGTPQRKTRVVFDSVLGLNRVSGQSNDMPRVGPKSFSNPECTIQAHQTRQDICRRKLWKTEPALTSTKSLRRVVCRRFRSTQSAAPRGLSCLGTEDDIFANVLDDGEDLESDTGAASPNPPSNSSTTGYEVDKWKGEKTTSKGSLEGWQQNAETREPHRSSASTEKWESSRGDGCSCSVMTSEPEPSQHVEAVLVDGAATLRRRTAQKQLIPAAVSDNVTSTAKKKRRPLHILNLNPNAGESAIRMLGNVPSSVDVIFIQEAKWKKEECPGKVVQFASLGWQAFIDHVYKDHMVADQQVLQRWRAKAWRSGKDHVTLYHNTLLRSRSLGGGFKHSWPM